MSEFVVTPLYPRGSGKIAKFMVGFFAIIFSINMVGLPYLLSINSALAEEFPGSVTVCKVVSDDSVLPGTKFTINSFIPSISSVLPPVSTFSSTVFTMPLSFNFDALSDVPGDDAECVTYNNLPLGGYHYDNEIIESDGTWEAPKYNDQFTTAVSTIVDFFTWDGNLYDGNPANDEERNQNADGHFNLTEDRPHRTLVVYNKLAPDDCEIDCDECTENCNTGPQSFTLTITTNGDGGGSVTSDDGLIHCDSANPEGNDCTETYSGGEDVVLTATPKEGSNFDNSWSGACTGNNPNCPVAMNSNQSVNAHFGLNVTPPPTPPTGCQSNCGGGGGGGGGGPVWTPTPTPTPNPSTSPGPSVTSTPEVLGATTTLPATSLPMADRVLFSIFTAMLATGAMMLIIGFGNAFKKQ